MKDSALGDDAVAGASRHVFKSLLTGEIPSIILLASLEADSTEKRFEEFFLSPFQVWKNSCTQPWWVRMMGPGCSDPV